MRRHAQLSGEKFMTARITVLGAGFGGMELSSILSESLGNEVQVTLIDQSDAFVFGYSKLDLMFGHTTLGRGPTAVPQLRQAGRAPVARIGDGHRPHDPARDNRYRDARLRLPGGSAGCRLRPRGHPGAERRQRVLLLGRGEPSSPDPARLHQGPRGHRRVRSAVQVPAGTQRMRAHAARPSVARGVREPMQHHDGPAPCRARCHPHPIPPGP